MPTLTDDYLSLIPFGLLLVAVLGLWISRSAWVIALIAAVTAAYLTGAVFALAGLWLAILAALAVAYRWARDRPRTTGARVLQACFGVAFFLMAIAIGGLVFPGFPRTELVSAGRLSFASGPFTIGLGFAKVVTGILILGIINDHVKVKSWRELGEVLRKAAPVFLVTLTAAVIVVNGIRYVSWDPKLTYMFLIWSPANLFFTCMTEEAFFRGFLQTEIARIGNNPRVFAIVGFVVATLLFGLSHFAGGWEYILGSTLAGAGYGYAYWRTGRIEAAMATHFGINAVHFLLFTYPRAA